MLLVKNLFLIAISSMISLFWLCCWASNFSSIQFWVRWWTINLPNMVFNTAARLYSVLPRFCTLSSKILSSATLFSPPFLALSFFILNPLQNIFSHFCSRQTLRGGSPLGFCSYSFFHLFLQFLPLSLINRLVSNLDKETKIKSHLWCDCFMFVFRILHFFYLEFYYLFINH